MQHTTCAKAQKKSIRRRSQKEQNKGLDDMILPLHTKRQFVAARNSLDSDVILGHAASQQALLGSSHQLVNNGCIPSRMNNGNAQSRA